MEGSVLLAIDELYFVVMGCILIVAVLGTFLLKYFLFGDDNIKSPKKDKKG